MAGKQMEGDNIERRKRAREARHEGDEPAEAQVTLGASKGREHVPRGADHEERLTAKEQGKRTGSRGAETEE